MSMQVATTALLGCALAVAMCPPASISAERLDRLVEKSGSPTAGTGGRRAEMLRRAAVSLPGLAGLLGRRRGGRVACGADRTFDLVAVCLHSGVPVETALRAVAESGGSGGPGDAGGVGDATGDDPLRRAAGRLRLGASAEEVFAELSADPDLGALGAVLEHSASTGASVGEALERAADRLRADEAAAALVRAERAGVLVAGPLGLCFLPAFVVLGIAPVIAGLAGDILPGLMP